MNFLKQHLAFILAFALTVVVFLFPLFFLNKAFLYSDNSTQFYPWLKVYADSVKKFSLPYWVSSMQSGFPLAAEGQTGVFYPLNLIIFFLFPFRLAYNFSVIIHFILAGIFMYLFTRKIGADQAGGYLSALLFCFGSAFGWCFYNIVTLRTLVWFPAVLFCLEQYLTKRKQQYLVYAGFISGMQFLAGFAQVAFYSFLFYLLYFFCRLDKVSRNLKAVFKFLAVFLLAAFFVSLPQILLTYQLAQFSMRTGATLSFALYGSFNPFGIFGMVFPFALQSIALNIYVGIISLFFVLFALTRFKENARLKGKIKGLIQAVRVEKGKSLVEFKFRPWGAS